NRACSAGEVPEDPTCGVRSTFGKRHSGCSGGKGSGSITSSAAPPRAPVSNAATSAGVSTTAPLETLTTYDPAGMAGSAWAFTTLLVASLRGAQITNADA